MKDYIDGDTNNMELEGKIVYILTNQSMPDTIKIGV